MKTKWYNVKKKSETRWTGFELDPDNLPELKRGYEMTGPYNSLGSAFKATFLNSKP